MQTLKWILFAKSGQMSWIAFGVGLATNVYVNIYPIFLQRYNRIRLLQLVRSSDVETVYSASMPMNDR